MKERIRQRALAMGFDECRFASAAPPVTASALERWLMNGWHGTMAWLARNAHKRVDPQQVLSGVKTVVVVAASYGEASPPTAPITHALPSAHAGDSAGASAPTSGADASHALGFVARYARFADYHDVLGARLKELAAWMDQQGGAGTRSLWYVDTGPVLEREFAQRAGIGFVGKNANVISRRAGNWILLGEILTTLELAPDTPEVNRCGSCVRCLAACPTGALVAPFQLDARRCLSYLTIELKEAIPVDLRPAVGHRVFGCDDCLAVCPWNRFARVSRLMQEQARAELAALDLRELLALDGAEFKRRFAGTPLARLKLRRLRRNVCVVLGNLGDATCRPALQAAAADPDPLVAEHAQWALDQLAHRRSDQGAAKAGA